ncbi:hypothetical protein CPB84DRAFT_1795617 [Gymnopilus junonius]|uniref:F-box domain-containing protein n=1 Tax=Gymnopilus junonius TaxID=109634 RepID=A0A9P5N9N9_GYMJU|nr:hypothetical protein CPB84DRAFT_1795617 [Gymnopilus junonius]
MDNSTITDRPVHSAVDRLCDDVLREIFLTCTSMFGSTLGYDDIEDLTDSIFYKYRVAHKPSVELPSDKQFLSPFPSSLNVPYVFLSVNRRWRSLAQSTHTLWNRISAMPNLSGKSRPSARFVQRWLQLSGNTTPLYLHIAPSDTPSQYNDEYMRASVEEKEEKATLGLFFEYAERCQVLSIQLNKGLCQKLNESMHPDSLHEPPKPFSQVETLEIDTRIVELFFDASGWLSFFPALRHFRLTEHRFGHVDLDDLPFSRLETLYLKKHLTLDCAVEIVRNCVSAREITLAGMLIGPLTHISEGPKTSLPNLTKISIRSDPFPGPLSLLNHFMMPNLDEPHSDLLNKFLVNSGCRLRKLSLIDQRIDVTEIATILSNPIILQIPEVEIVYAVEWLRDVPETRSKDCRNMKSPDVLRYYVETRHFFESQGIDLLFWTRAEHFEINHLYSPYKVWEHVGWDKDLRGERREMDWEDHLTGKLYAIGTRIQREYHNKCPDFTELVDIHHRTSVAL